MPFPLPDVSDEEPGVVAQVLNLMPVERKTAGMEEMDAQIDEGDKQQQMKRRHYV